MFPMLVVCVLFCVRALLVLGLLASFAGEVVCCLAVVVVLFMMLLFCLLELCLLLEFGLPSADWLLKVFLLN